MYRLRSPKFQVGDVYMDCAGHPVVCTESIPVVTGWLRVRDWDLAGVSLLDGSAPRSCSVRHCAPQRLSWPVAVQILALMLGSDQSLEAVMRRRMAAERRIQAVLQGLTAF